MVAGNSREEILLQHRLVGNCPFLLCKLGCETGTVKVIAITLWILLWKAAILFQHVSWSFTGIQGWSLWVFYGQLYLWQEARLPLHPSSSFICPSPASVLVSILTTLFFSEIPTPRRGEAEERGEKHLWSPTACKPGASGRVAVQHSVLLSHHIRSAQAAQGDEVVCKVGYPLRTHDWSMMDRVFAEESSQVPNMRSFHREQCLAK